MSSQALKKAFLKLYHLAYFSKYDSFLLFVTHFFNTPLWRKNSRVAPSFKKASPTSFKKA